MKKFFNNYNKYIIPLLIIYLGINIIKSLFNIYILFVLLVITLFVYNTNKRLFKKILYKTIFRNKSYKLKNKVKAAQKSLKEIICGKNS